MMHFALLYLLFFVYIYFVNFLLIFALQLVVEFLSKQANKKNYLFLTAAK
jgi:hypothetical protein